MYSLHKKQSDYRRSQGLLMTGAVRLRLAELCLLHMSVRRFMLRVRKVGEEGVHRYLMSRSFLRRKLVSCVGHGIWKPPEMMFCWWKYDLGAGLFLLVGGWSNSSCWGNGSLGLERPSGYKLEQNERTPRASASAASCHLCLSPNF